MFLMYFFCFVSPVSCFLLLASFSGSGCCFLLSAFCYLLSAF